MRLIYEEKKETDKALTHHSGYSPITGFFSIFFPTGF